jgi:hypothetical protein
MKRGRVREKGGVGLTGATNTDLHRIRLASIRSNHPPSDLAKSSTESGHAHHICVWAPISSPPHRRARRAHVSSLPPCRRGRRRRACGPRHLHASGPHCLFVTSMCMERERHASTQIRPPCQTVRWDVVHLASTPVSEACGRWRRECS